MKIHLEVNNKLNDEFMRGGCLIKALSINNN